MKFYSEITNEKYDTMKELEDAEVAFKEAKEAEAVAAAEAKEVVSKERKTFAKEVEDAETKLTEAYDRYEAVKKECAELREKVNKEIEEKLKPVKMNW